MQIKTLIVGIVISVFLASHALGQEEELKAVHTIPLDSGAIWAVDLSQQVYIYQRQNISRWTPQGKLGLEQSIKQIGEIRSIDATNQLKIAVFSEQQQQVCFLDNGLALANDCISLNDLEVEWATLFCTSNQTDRFWIYDQINNELKLLSTSVQQQQQIQNLKQIVDIGVLDLMVEKENNLYIIDEKNVLVHFDIYGTLVNSFELGDFDHIFFTDNAIFGMKDKQLTQLFTFSNNIFNPIPAMMVPEEITEKIVSIRASSDHLYFATQNNLFVYRIK